MISRCMYLQVFILLELHHLLQFIKVIDNGGQSLLHIHIYLFLSAIHSGLY